METQIIYALSITTAFLAIMLLVNRRQNRKQKKGLLEQIKALEQNSAKEYLKEFKAKTFFNSPYDAVELIDKITYYAGDILENINIEKGKDQLWDFKKGEVIPLDPSNLVQKQELELRYLAFALRCMPEGKRRKEALCPDDVNFRIFSRENKLLDDLYHDPQTLYIMKEVEGLHEYKILLIILYMLNGSNFKQAMWGVKDHDWKL